MLHLHNSYKKIRVRFSYVLYIVIILTITISSCKSKGDKYIDEGEIHFKIEYKGRFAYPTEALPQNLVVSFKDNKVLFQMIGWGRSGIINLSNPEEGIFDTYYNFMGVQKYYYAGKPGEIFPGFEAMKTMEINKTSRTQKICGYDCKNAEVTFQGDRSKKYSIWYTDQINIDEPNASTPFQEIDGVLLAFFFIMGKSELHFSAENVFSKELPDNIFERREKFVRVSKSDIVDLMDEMLESEKP